MARRTFVANPAIDPRRRQRVQLRDRHITARARCARRCCQGVLIIALPSVGDARICLDNVAACLLRTSGVAEDELADARAIVRTGIIEECRARLITI